MTRSVVVMARHPGSGPVKTRLAARIGADAALAFYRDTLDGILRRLAGPLWNTVVAVTPARCAAGPAAWTRGLPVIAQPPGDLGERMQAAVDAMPPGPVVVVGSDVPDLRSGHVAAAFRALRRCDVVFGPSRDGGYWLIGVAPVLRGRRLFGPVRWSTRHALADTLAGLPEGAGTVRLDVLDDIDTFDDLVRWRRVAARRGPV